MNKWSPERAEAIRRYIDEYFLENYKAPSVRDIAAGTGISKTAVQRYLTEMKESGEIEKSGHRGITTNLVKTMALRFHCVLWITNRAESGRERACAIANINRRRGKVFYPHRKRRLNDGRWY